MKNCEEFILEIGNSAGAYSQALMQHCARCPSCRQELKRQLSVAHVASLSEVPPALDRRVLSACREQLGSVWQRRLFRPLLYAGTAAAALWFVSLMLEPLSAPSDGKLHRRGAESAAIDWEGTRIMEQIEWIGMAIDQTRWDMASEWVDADDNVNSLNDDQVNESGSHL